MLALAQLNARLPLLVDMLAGEPALQTFLLRAAETVAGRIMGLDRQGVPRGPCHGDYHYANIIVLADRAIAVHDFSDCGEDFLAADLAPFMWRADFDGVSEHLTPAFIAGYSAVRPLGPAEKVALPLFRAARHLAMASAFAATFNRIGPVPGFDANLRYYVSMVRLFCAEIGIT
jgi:Ser/Thr protein kinase RdoA (MazF antagonist)